MKTRISVLLLILSYVFVVVINLNYGHSLIPARGGTIKFILNGLAIFGFFQLVYLIVTVLVDLGKKSVNKSDDKDSDVILDREK